MSLSKPNVFDHARVDFIPLYDIPSEEIDAHRTSSISAYIDEHVHPPSTGYRLVSAAFWIKFIPNPGHLASVSQQFADNFRIKGDTIRKIMTETDSLMPLDHHIIPIIDNYISSLDLSGHEGFAVQLQSELTIHLKDVKKEGVVEENAKSGDEPQKKRRKKTTYPIFRPDRVWGLTFIKDDPSSQSPQSPLMRDASYNASVTVHQTSRDDAESIHSQHDDDEQEDTRMAVLPDQLVSRESEIHEDEVMSDDEETDNIKGQTDYGERSRLFFPKGDDGIPGRTKIFAILEGKMAGIIFRCRENLKAAAEHGQDFDNNSMSLLKQVYAYALAFRTRHTALYDYTTLVLIRWNHLTPDHTAAELFKRWNTKLAAAKLRKEVAELTVVVDRGLMVPTLAGFLINAQMASPHWSPPA